MYLTDEKTPLVLLTAGKSSRMGMPKGLLAVEDGTWLEAQLEAFSKFGREVVVVLGYSHVDYLSRLPFLRNALDSNAGTLFGQLRISVVINENPELGPFSSLQAGLKKLSPGVPAFVLPVDVPAAEPEVWRRLEEEARRLAVDVCVPEYEGRRGHPVWLSGAFVEKLKKLLPLCEEARLDVQIHSLPDEKQCVVLVDDSKTCGNLNTVEDFSAFLRGRR